MTKFEFLELVLEEDGGKNSLVTEFLKGKRQKNAVRLMTEQVIIQIFLVFSENGPISTNRDN